MRMRVRRRMKEIVEWGKNNSVCEYIDNREVAMYMNGVNFAAESLAKMSGAAVEQTAQSSSAAAETTCVKQNQTNETNAVTLAASAGLPPEVQQIMASNYLPDVVDPPPSKIGQPKKSNKPKKKGIEQ